MEKTDGEDVTESLGSAKSTPAEIFQEKDSFRADPEILSEMGAGRTGQTPGNTSTPEEAEETAGVADPKAHQIYEKARYSRLECTAEEAAYLKKRN